MIKLSTQIHRILEIISDEDPCDQTRRSAKYVSKIMKKQNIDDVFDIPDPNNFLIVRAHVDSGIIVWNINQNYGHHYRVIGQAVYNESFPADKDAKDGISVASEEDSKKPSQILFRQIRLKTIYERLMHHESNIKYAIKNNPLDYQLSYIFDYKNTIDIRGEIAIPYSKDNITYTRDEDDEEKKTYHAYNLGPASEYFQEKLYSYFQEYETKLKNIIDKYIDHREDYCDLLTKIHRSGTYDDITKNYI